MIGLDDFQSKNCKSGNHLNCAGRWVGLGIEVNCNCECRHNKKQVALAQVEGPETNAGNDPAISGENTHR